MAALAVVSAAGSPPREPSVARGELADAIRQLAVLLKERDDAAAPVNRLAELDGAFNQAKAELDQHRAADDAQLGEWLINGAHGQRPQPSSATLAAEKRIGELARDAAAAATALPPKQAALDAINSQVRAVQQRRDELRLRVAIEAASAFAATDFKIALNAALVTEGTLRGLLGALYELGHIGTGDSDALRTAEVLDGLIADAKRSAVTTVNPSRGRKLLAALLTDPNAEL
jgi:hypothetical protein